MLTNSMEKKLLRKQKRCQCLITKDTNIQCVDFPTQYVAICNAGLSTGLQLEQLLNEINKYNTFPKDVIMLPAKSYCFVECTNENDSETIYQNLHGKTNLAQNDGVLYLSYCRSVPKVVNPWNQPLPSGLILLENFIDAREENRLLNCINWNHTNNNNTEDFNKDGHGSTLKHRQVKHYGYEFIYGCNNVDINKPLTDKIPPECSELLLQLKTKLPSSLTWYEPNQMTVNCYEPGNGIPSHCDTHSAFHNPIISISLAGDIVMEFRNPQNNQLVYLLLPKRSALVMSGESRYGWTHGIKPRKYDIIYKSNYGLTTIKRSTRISLTFRCLRTEPCNCNFSYLCDTYEKNQAHKLSNNNNNNINDNNDNKNSIHLEEENVHKVYNEIANHFSETRHTPWPNVEKYINAFESGSIFIDIGCGNGKYLNVNDNILKIGCDRSNGLLNVCKQRQLNVFQCDCLYLPIRSNSVDGCMSIAVIHHLSTKDRRLQAIKEMARILKVDGKGLIYVWAKNQTADNKKSSYLRQNKYNAATSSSQPPTQIKQNATINNLPIHTNRTEFKHQDILVPWKLKDTTVNNSEIRTESFLRYYHVFEENELETLCNEINTITIINSYYDQGNWCILFNKI